MERQTDLTLEEIVRQLRAQSGQGSGCHACHSDDSYPPCLLANEAGVMAESGDLVAEAFLCELLLSSNDMTLRAISYAYLKNLPQKQPGTAEAIKVFMTDPQNADVIRMVEEKEAEEREDILRLAEEKLPGSS